MGKVCGCIEYVGVKWVKYVGEVGGLSMWVRLVKCVGKVCGCSERVWVKLEGKVCGCSWRVWVKWGVKYVGAVVSVGEVGG